MPVFSSESPNFSAVAGEDIDAGEIVSIGPDGLAYLACAATGKVELSAAGVAETSVDSGERLEIKREGRVVSCTGLTPGALVYVSNTAGGYSTSAGNTSCQIGFAISTTEFILCPEQIAQQSQHSS